MILLSKKIYLVEDEISLNLLLEKYLQREGYAVTTFSNGNSAIEKIEDSPDFWILDIMLPDIDGYQIIKAIKSYNKNTPVIFMSARNEELDRVVGLELGSDDYFGSDRVVDDVIRRLRKKIDKLTIETVYGYGYKLVYKS